MKRFWSYVQLPLLIMVPVFCVVGDIAHGISLGILLLYAQAEEHNLEKQP